MSQLIALIIAIALGSIVTAIGFVFLGDAFTKNSERGVALQFVTQAAQIESVFSIYRVEKSKGSFTSGSTPTGTETQEINDWFSTQNTLLTEDYLSYQVIPPKGKYMLFNQSNGVYLVATFFNSNGEDISQNTCEEIEILAGRNRNFTVEPLIGVSNIIELITVLDNNRYGCYQTIDGSIRGFIYKVE